MDHPDRNRESQVSGESPNQTEAKRPYHPPKVQDFGSVQDLTGSNMLLMNSVEVNAPTYPFSAT